MINKILKKRTRVELEAWQAVRNLMPRNRKTKGIQYETLEFLFDNLYQRVPEEDLEAHLRIIKGHLQKTGDPVKGAINQAIKELQRLPDRPFQLTKIQEATIEGPRRFVKLDFTRFEEVISLEMYTEYLQDVLENENDLVVRGISHVFYEDPSHLFPGFTLEHLATCRAEFLVPHKVVWPQTSRVQCRFIPKSTANLHLLLLYENGGQDLPFLGFIARGTADMDAQEFILYRGNEKMSKLAFFDHIWQDLYERALDRDKLNALCEEAKSLSAVETIQDLILEGLISKSCAS